MTEPAYAIDPDEGQFPSIHESKKASADYFNAQSRDLADAGLHPEQLPDELRRRLTHPFG
jgi:hypothetical protein